jgi:uncharacterized protein (UPF0332 family)
MNDEASQHMQRAARLLESVETRVDTDDPGAIASTAYYAMFHAACAVLLDRTGRLPKTHSSLIGQFGLTVRDLGVDGREAGASLHAAFNRRFTADYAVAVQLDRKDAMKARNDARFLIEYCRQLQRRKSF